MPGQKENVVVEINTETSSPSGLELVVRAEPPATATKTTSTGKETVIQWHLLKTVLVGVGSLQWDLGVREGEWIQLGIQQVGMGVGRLAKLT